jgi:trans-2,3-dihydro-3-hydroxyanthranilate isomerase
MQRHFTTLDVFTNERFSGNPLAVVSGSEDLDAARMQAIAREFGLPETSSRPQWSCPSQVIRPWAPLS